MFVFIALSTYSRAAPFYVPKMPSARRALKERIVTVCNRRSYCDFTSLDGMC
jgi:hypothetical protein